jgi:ATP-binding cassette subfamily B protein/ATP-binding cassette subfamily C protein
MGSASSFVSQLSTIDEDLGNLFDYQEFMSLPLMRQGGAQLQAAPEVVRFEHVSFRYPQTKNDVLQDVTFEIRRGQHIAIVGENGAGKTTLIKLLTGLYLPTKGVVMADDISFSHLDSESWHRQLSVLHQGFEKYVFTDIENNVYFGDVSRPLNRTRLHESLVKAEAETFVDKLPKKLKTYASTWMEDDDGNKGTQLSGGQWQRLALARSFYRDAPIVILDEPTSAIDAVAEARIFKRLFAKSNDKTVVTISHRLTTVEKADKIIVLADGKIVESGTHAELARKKGEYYRIFADQLDRPSDV